MTTPTLDYSPAFLKAWRARLTIGEAGLASLLGIPVHTLRKWENGTRRPDAAPLRLMTLLHRVEIEAPSLFAALLSEARASAPDQPVAAPKRRGKGKVATKAEKPASGPVAVSAGVSAPTLAALTPPAPWLQVAYALPEWMKTAA
jgi:transcriptional regulator with XRE-family HTH domain